VVQPRKLGRKSCATVVVFREDMFACFMAAAVAHFIKHSPCLLHTPSMGRRDLSLQHVPRPHAKGSMVRLFLRWTVGGGTGLRRRYSGKHWTCFNQCTVVQASCQIIAYSPIKVMQGCKHSEIEASSLVLASGTFSIYLKTHTSSHPSGRIKSHRCYFSTSMRSQGG